MSSIYELTGELLQLQDLLESDCEDEALKDTLEAVTGEYEIKLEGYCRVIKNLEADSKALKNEAKRLTDRSKSLDNNIERLKKAMFDSMKVTQTTKVKGQIFTVSIQKNGGVIPVVVAPGTDTSKLPDELVIITEKPDLERIRECLENGIKIEGFTLGERGESLRIK